MAVLNPEWSPKSWWDLVLFFKNVYCCGSWIIFIIYLVLAIIFELLVWFYLFPKLGVGYV